MITFKIGKAICPVCEIKNSNLQLLSSFLLSKKIEQKRKLDDFFFKGENESKTFKNF